MKYNEPRDFGQLLIYCSCMDPSGVIFSRSVPQLFAWFLSNFHVKDPKNRTPIIFHHFRSAKLVSVSNTILI